LSCGTCSNPCCAAGSCSPLAADRGIVYETLQSDSGGYYGDLCSQDFSPYVSDIASNETSAAKWSCSFPVPAAPEGIEIATQSNVSMSLTSSSDATPIRNVPGADGCASGQGWYFNGDFDGGVETITLCPASCDELRGAQEPSLEVEFGCPTID
jgi:hypothetical protein